MPADLAAHANAVTEGFIRTQLDRGVGANPRYMSRYEKPFDGDSQSGGLSQFEGYSNVDQATADANALVSLNGHRRHIFGGDATNVNKGPRSNATLTVGRHC